MPELGLDKGMYNIGTPDCPVFDFNTNAGVFEGSTENIILGYMKEFGQTVSKEAGEYLATFKSHLFHNRDEAMDYLHNNCGIPTSHLEKFDDMKDYIVQSLGLAGYDVHLKALDTVYKIPAWLKNSAGWWSEGKVSDGEFVNSLTYLIKNGIVKVSAVGSKVAGDTIIPDWVRNNAGWWASDKITTQDFVNAIQYLLQHDIIRV